MTQEKTTRALAKKANRLCRDGIYPNDAVNLAFCSLDLNLPVYHAGEGWLGAASTGEPVMLTWKGLYSEIPGLEQE